MDRQSRIYVAGHRGMVGSAIVRRLRAAGYRRLLLRSRAELDLLDQNAVKQFFRANRPEYVFLAAARVGGIHANATHPAEFIHQNLTIQTNVIHASWSYRVRKLLFLGSSCIYPRLAPQPLTEEALLSGKLEPTNAPYAVAKIAGIEMCKAYQRQYGFQAISLMPTNLYGPNDNFNLESAHVLPALLRKFHEAKVNGAFSVTVWGSGKPRREFLHVNDLADASVFLMHECEGGALINVGTGEDISIADLCGIIQNAVGYRGAIEWDSHMPDGTPQKLLDVSRLTELGWSPRVSLRDGIQQTYEWFRRYIAKNGTAQLREMRQWSGTPRELLSSRTHG